MRSWLLAGWGMHSWPIHRDSARKEYLFRALGISRGRELVSWNIWKSRKIYHGADYSFFWKTPINPPLSIGRHYSFCSVVHVIPCQPRHINLLDICGWSTRFITLDCPWIPLKGNAMKSQRKVTKGVLFLSKWYLKGRGVVCWGGATLFKFLLTKYPLGAGGKTF